MTRGFTKDGKFRPIDNHQSAIHATDIQLNRIYKKKNPTKKESLQLALHDADRRYEIGTGKMSEITKRIHELEVERNQSLRRNLILNELQKTTDPVIISHLQNELKNLPNDSTRDEIYREIMTGYKPMSRRKNELQEERNQYVKEIEELNKKW